MLWDNNNFNYSKSFNIYESPFNFEAGKKYNLKLLDTYGDGWSYGIVLDNIIYNDTSIKFTDGYELEIEIIAGEGVYLKN